MSAGLLALGVDYGDVRTGIAVSDPTGFLARGLTIVRSANPEYVADNVARLAQQYGAAVIVVGLPLNMDGTEGPRAEKARAFAALTAEKSGRPVEFSDERRTTVEAYDILRTGGKNAKKGKKVVDAVAAELILQQWLDSK